MGRNFMIVMGLHFGHDASISIVRDGEILLCVERERLSRVKHAITLTSEDIETCLADVGLSVDDVDYCGLTSTQMVEYLFVEPDKLSITLAPHPLHILPCTITDHLGVCPNDMRSMSSGLLESIFRSPDHHYYKKLFGEGFRFDLEPNRFLGGFEHFIQSPVWERKRTLEEISSMSYAPFLEADEVSHGFHYPATLNILGKKIPAYIFSHHFAHAAYAFYESPFDEAAILSHDGGGGGGQYGCGLFAYGRGNRLYPLTPHHLAVGELYDYASMRVGFDAVGGAGKLMGLAAYGKPRFFSPDFVGNWHDIHQKSATQWIAHCEQKARELNYDMAPFGDASNNLSPINVDFAASCQKVVEESMLQAVFALKQAVFNSVGDVQALCLSGGVALNCPSNSRIYNEGPFNAVSVLSAVIDSGLSIGSALAIYYNMAGIPRHSPKLTSPLQGYLGLQKSSENDLVKSVLNKFSEVIEFEIVKNSANEAALCLHADQIIGWFYGRSEIGPRALGHRSILANPKFADNWARVNKIKKRELWRPFAPAVLAEEESRYFDSTQLPSYFMLLNAQVRSREIPAVTHVDGSARVQSVTRECGQFYELIKSFGELSGTPVVLNTSFNGPGEPVIETPEEAVHFLISSELDALFFDGIKVRKKS